MQTYEFLAKPENGFIAIPEDLRSKIASNVRVILHEIMLDSDTIPGSTRKSDLVLPPTLDTRNWKFDREDANER